MQKTNSTQTKNRKCAIGLFIILFSFFLLFSTGVMGATSSNIDLGQKYVVTEINDFNGRIWEDGVFNYTQNLTISYPNNHLRVNLYDLAALERHFEVVGLSSVDSGQIKMRIEGINVSQNNADVTFYVGSIVFAITYKLPTSTQVKTLTSGPLGTGVAIINFTDLANTRNVTVNITFNNSKKLYDINFIGDGASISYYNQPYFDYNFTKSFNESIPAQPLTFVMDFGNVDKNYTVDLMYINLTTPQKLLTPTAGKVIGWGVDYYTNYTWLNAKGILDKYDASGTIYAGGNPLDVYSDYHRLLLNEGWDLGLHTQHELSSLPLDVAYEELLNESNNLSLQFGVSPFGFTALGNALNRSHVNYAYNNLSMISRANSGYGINKYNAPFMHTAYEVDYNERTLIPLFNKSSVLNFYTHKIYSVDGEAPTNLNIKNTTLDSLFNLAYDNGVWITGFKNMYYAMYNTKNVSYTNINFGYDGYSFSVITNYGNVWTVINDYYNITRNDWWYITDAIGKFRIYHNVSNLEMWTGTASYTLLNATFLDSVDNGLSITNYNYNSGTKTLTLTCEGTGNIGLSGLSSIGGTHGYYMVYHDAVFIGYSNSNTYNTTSCSDWLFIQSGISNPTVTESSNDIVTGLGQFAAWLSLIFIVVVLGFVGFLLFNQSNTSMEQVKAAVFIIVLTAIILAIGIIVISAIGTS